MTRLIFRLATIALLAAPTWTVRADASAVQTYYYNTTGNVAGFTGITSDYPPGLGGLPITFQGQPGTNILTTPGDSNSPFNLGSFINNPLPPGATLTYNNTPFAINLNLGSMPGDNALVSPTYTYKLNGALNGSLTSDGTSTLFSTLTSVTGSGDNPPFPFTALIYPSQKAFGSTGLYEGGPTYGIAPVVATVDVTGNPLPSPAPEPTSVAVFAAALAGWAWKRRRLAARDASG